MGKEGKKDYLANCYKKTDLYNFESGIINEAPIIRNHNE